MRPTLAPRSALLLATTLTLALCGGCHIVTGEAATSEQEGDANKLFNGDSGAAADTGGGGGSCDCIKEGDWYRFDTLEVTALDKEKHNVIGVLNNLWKNDIEKFELNFYYRVEKVTATEVTLKVINGARVDGSEKDTCLLPYTETQLIAPRDGCTIDESQPSGMNVYAGTETNKKNCAPKNTVPHSIEVKKVVISAEMSSDCSKVITGKVVSGALAQAALEQTCTCVNPGQDAEVCGVLDPAYKGNDCDGCSDKYQNLKTLLQNFGDLKWACDVDGKPAVCLEAKFTATRLDKAPTVCTTK